MFTCVDLHDLYKWEDRSTCLSSWILTQNEPFLRSELMPGSFWTYCILINRQMQSEFMPELHRWISKSTARYLKVLHREMLRWVLGQGSLLPLCQGEAFTSAPISYLAILAKVFTGKDLVITMVKEMVILYKKSFEKWEKVIFLIYLKVMKMRNDWEIACDCVKSAHVGLHVGLCNKNICQEAQSYPHVQADICSAPDSDHDDTHTPIFRLWSP